MIEFARITGKVEDNYIQVKLRTGEHLYAPVVVIGTGATIPSSEWVQDNKDNFLALLTYEKDMPISPFIIGFYPVKGADSSSYNSVERLIKVVSSLMDELIKAKVNTMLGPQPFLPSSIKEFSDLQIELKDIKSQILEIKL